MIPDDKEKMMEYTEQDIQSELKSLSQNAFVRFFQKIWRWWLGKWYGYCDRHPKLSPWIYKVFFFLVFSYGVTIWQFIVMTFLPYAFASLDNGAWGWPGTVLSFASNNGATYIILGDTNGLGYFIAYEIAVFTAQCINFPLQRNITYRSHGNPWYQAMWYFIGWVLVSVFTLAIWGFINVFFTSWGWYLPGNEGLATVAGLVKTVLTGGVSMVIFFFIFMIIFPDNNAVAKRAKAKCDRLEAKGVTGDKLEKARQKYAAATQKAALSNAEAEAVQARSRFNSAAMRYMALAKEKENDAAIAESFEQAKEALAVKREKEAAFDAVKNQQAKEAA